MHEPVHRLSPIILASGSEIRREMLLRAGVEHESIPAKVDEAAIKASLMAEGASARDLADALAEMKARKISERHPWHLVLGCDQVLAFKGDVISKPVSEEDAKGQLRLLRSETHQLLSAVVIYESAEPVWRHVGTARLTMREFSDTYLDDYVTRNWDSIRWSVGGYKIEEEGIRLFSNITGDIFTIQGLPLLPLLSYLTLRGTLPA